MLSSRFVRQTRGQEGGRQGGETSTDRHKRGKGEGEVWPAGWCGIHRRRRRNSFSSCWCPRQMQQTYCLAKLFFGRSSEGRIGGERKRLLIVQVERRGGKCPLGHPRSNRGDDERKKMLKLSGKLFGQVLQCRSRWRRWPRSESVGRFGGPAGRGEGTRYHTLLHTRPSGFCVGGRGGYFHDVDRWRGEDGYW